MLMTDAEARNLLEPYRNDRTLHLDHLPPLPPALAGMSMEDRRQIAAWLVAWDQADGFIFSDDNGFSLRHIVAVIAGFAGPSPSSPS